jgi:NAD(P)-dependent dehydrogenase (short-subunit alcohol dehydrogenase family)
MATKHVFVTGASSGIGLALCKLLVRDHGCYVYLGARNVEKGEACLKGILAEVPAAAGKIEVVQLDVVDNASIAACAEKLKAKGVVLYGLVNNAGVGLAQSNAPKEAVGILDTNFLGVKRVTEAMVGLVDPSGGRIVNVSSGAASGWVKGQDAPTKALFSKVGLTFDELEAAVKAAVAANNLGWGNGYGLSKAALSALTLVHAAQYPNLKVVALSPGFIDTPMTAGFGARLTPEQGCRSSVKCLFDEVISGYYYGSDGLRSPFTMTRDPGTPEYQGEDDPQQATYNN